ncbi:hypothetical protein AnigIFM62618_006012 [Aspergillus niger]|nr:hypothetical protein AnigIFM62618_006012 [Aspergillus niger]
MTVSSFRVKLPAEVSQPSSVVTVGPSPNTLAPWNKKIHCRWIFLTYTDCSLEHEVDFVEGLRAMLKGKSLASDRFYGCCEKYTQKGIVYHVLLHLGKQVNWKASHARRVLLVSNSPHESINILTPRPGQNVGNFIESHVKYCEKVANDDCFGKRPSISAAQEARRRRKWVECGQQPTKAAKRAKIME